MSWKPCKRTWRREAHSPLKSPVGSHYTRWSGPSFIFVVRQVIFMTILCCDGVLLVATSSSISPVMVAGANHVRRQDFSWTASLDASTGTASSCEISAIPPACKLHRSLEACKNNKQIVSIAESLFPSYPTWLARLSVTFGLLRAVPLEKGGGTSLRDSLVGSNLLTFGRPCKTTVAVQRWSQYKTTRYTVTLPVIGGLLAYYPSSSSKKKGECGALTFSVVKMQATKHKSTFSLETEIANGYRPAIAGGAPVPWLRKLTYRSTQSLVHAYVMWRFHRQCHGSAFYDSSSLE